MVFLRRLSNALLTSFTTGSDQTRW
jgi:hypothetical protein